MTPHGSLNPLSCGHLLRRVARIIRMSAYLGGVAAGVLLLNNCSDGGVGIGAAVEQMASSAASASAASSSSSQSSSSARSKWVDLAADFPGHIVSQIAMVPGQDRLLALSGVSPAGYYTANLYSSVDGGATWQQLGQGAGSAALTVFPVGVVFDPKDAQSNTFWIFGTFAGSTGGLFSTTDGGKTFQAHAVGTAPYDIDGLSIDPGGGTMLAGQPQQAQAVYKSTDGGTSWTNIGAGLPPVSADAEYPYVIDGQTYLIGLSFISGGTPEILRTVDSGSTWSQVAQGYRVFGAPTAINGILYWSFYNGADGGILASSDQGQSWQVVVPGGLTWSVIPMAQPDGQFGSLSGSNEIMLFTPGMTEQPTVVQPAFPLTVSLTQGGLIGLTFNAVRNAYFGWVVGGGIQRLDMQ